MNGNEAKALCEAQLSQLNAIDLGSAVKAADAKVDDVADTVLSIEDNASRLESEPAFDIDLSVADKHAADSKLESTQTFTV